MKQEIGAIITITLGLTLIQYLTELDLELLKNIIISSLIIIGVNKELPVVTSTALLIHLIGLEMILVSLPFLMHKSQTTYQP